MAIGNDTPSNTSWFSGWHVWMALLVFAIVGGAGWYSYKNFNKPAPVVTAPLAPKPIVLEKYVVKPGDALSRRFGKIAGEKVCAFNRLPDCDVLAVRQVLLLPQGITSRAKMLPIGEYRWKNLGGAALKNASSLEEVRQQARTITGLNPNEIAELGSKFGKPDYQKTYKKGDRMVNITFLKDDQTVMMKRNVVADFPDGVTATANIYKLVSGGRVVEYAHVAECDNEGIDSIKTATPQ